MSRKLSLTLACVAAIGCIGVFAGQASAASAGPGRATGGAPRSAVPSRLQPGGRVPGGFASWAALYAMQHQLDVAATKIAAADGAGRVGIEVSAVDRELSVYWPGAVPAPVRTLAGRLGVHITFHRAAFSQRTLVTAAQRLAAIPGIADAAPKADGSGLAVRVISAATGKAATAKAVRVASGIPLTITTGQQSQAAFGRQLDNPPFSGGSRYSSPVGLCSNGFALSGNVDMLSAGHCGSNGQSVSIGFPAWTGTILNQNACRDTLEINYPVYSAGRIYTGGYNSFTTTGVAGATPDFVGDLVETSGASSGEHDNIPVRAVDVFGYVTGSPCGGLVGPLDEASYGDGVSCAAALGDSGGPVFSFFGSGGVLGRGTITSIYPDVSCPGISSTGSDTVFYAPLVRPPYDPQIGTLQYYGVSLATS